MRIMKSKSCLVPFSSFGFCVKDENSKNILNQSVGTNLMICLEIIENEAVSNFNSGLLKSLAAGEKQILICNGKEFSAKLCCKNIFVTNSYPNFADNDIGIAKRLNIIQFPEFFSENNGNRKNPNDISQFFEENLDELFTWMCLGSQMWYNDNSGQNN